jgi:hypothetical protein
VKIMVTHPGYLQATAGMSHGGSMPRDDDDLVGRIIAALEQTAQWQWIDEQMRLDQRAHDMEMSSGDDEPMRMSAAGDEDESGEMSGEEPERLSAATAGGAGGNTFTPDDRSFSGESPSGLAEHEQEQGRRLHSRRSKENSHFRYFAPDPESGLPIAAKRFGSPASVRQRQPKQGAVYELEARRLYDALRAGHLSEEETNAALAMLRKKERESKDFSEAMERQYGPAASQINTSVDTRTRTSEPMEPGEADEQDRAFSQRLFDMDAEAREAYRRAHRHSGGMSYDEAVRAAAKSQRVRHARKLHERRQSASAEWVSEDEPDRFNKAAALACAKRALTTGQSYEAVVTDFARTR